MKWVTRERPKTDRIACPWLIRRFIDSDAEILYVPRDQVLRVAEVEGARSFDAPDAEFTHRANKCTFEVLLDRIALNDPALRAIAEIIHDIDLRDSKFSRDEAVGIRTLIDGIALTTPDDLERIARGTEVFNNLYEVFGKKRQ